MARRFLMCLFVWTGLLSPAFAGEIRDIKLIKEAKNEIEVMVEGTYSSYRAFTLQAPYRFIIDIEGAVLRKGLQKAIEVKGDVVSKVRAGQGGNRSRIVLDSAKKGEPFHSNIQEKAGGLLIKCWRPGEGKQETDKESTKTAKVPTDSLDLPKKDLKDLFGSDEDEPEEKPADQAEKKVERYTGQKITLDLYKTDIHNVFRLLAEISGKNIIVDEQVKGEVTLAIKEVPWDLAMDIILEKKNLRKDEKANTLIISPRTEKAEGMGELSVRTVSENALRAERLRKTAQVNRQRAQKIIIDAHNFETQGNKAKALALYEKAFELWNTNTDLIKKTAYLHYIMGNYAKSYYYAGEAIKLNSKDAEAALYAALSAAAMDKKDEAKMLFEAALKGSPKMPEAFYNYGLFLEKQYEYPNAVYIYSRYEKIFGPSLKVSLAIARLLDAQDKAEEACKRYRQIQFSGFSMDEYTEGMVRKRIETLCKQGEN
ncbi:AMIN domain-containing protein [Thermodesulfobacteriota bacterium]